MKAAEYIYLWFKQKLPECSETDREGTHFTKFEMDSGFRDGILLKKKIYLYPILYEIKNNGIYIRGGCDEIYQEWYFFPFYMITSIQINILTKNRKKDIIKDLKKKVK
ncbi:MAG: hypothetical protein ACFFDN_26585 [Candidatus Hodarchaeota archaeon]